MKSFQPIPLPASTKRFFSLKYQFLLALGLILVVSFATFYFVARNIIVSDKKLLIRDLNLALMDGTYGAISKAIVQRASEIVQIVSFHHITENPTETNVQDLFNAFRPPVSEEIFRIRFYRRAQDNRLEPFADYRNKALLEKKKYGLDFFERIDKAHPPNLGRTMAERAIMLDNISTQINVDGKEKPFFGMSLSVSARPADKSGSGWLVRVDIDQSFVIHSLKVSDLSEIFMVTRSGQLISHTNADMLLAERSRYQHPILERLQEITQQSESVELDTGGQRYMASVREAGFPEVFLVSQIPQSEVFRSMKELFRSTTFVASLILYLAFLGSVFFASRVTVNLKRLAFAAKRIGRGEFDVKIKVDDREERVTDEVGQLSKGFQVMAREIKSLLDETAEKSRMENELKTASLLQATVLIAPELRSSNFDITNCYIPATECSGDFLDAFVVGNKVFLAVADATGHGASAAIVTAVAKSCLLTIRLMQPDELPSPEIILTALNRVVYGACQGELLMTMCLVRLDLESGEVLVANAGHESPLCVRKAGEGDKVKAEEFFARGERLGFAAETAFTSETFSLSPGDTMLLYTDGVSEATNRQGAEWGARQLKKSFAKAVGGDATPQKIRDFLLGELRGHIGSQPPKDDVTFSVLRFARAA